MYKIVKTKFKDLIIVQNYPYKDMRGKLLFGSFANALKKKFVHEYTSISKKNVFRGFHYQYKKKQGKLITVLHGEILDCVIDLRKNSKTYKKNFKIRLSSNNNKSLYIPPAFAHGYYVIKNDTVVNCKQTNFFNSRFEKGIIWNDKSLKLKWRFKNPILSTKDKNQPSYQS